ncbi:potassium-transporting ATPase subunit KdpC [Alicyclobacillus dauci]|uniref:Potassium-transporting ATPase KdpC subunit n=1 Tax=Alicyclobacillus dauci TaxID=1475485 RepID=A0ABY6Z1H0_9BACL|nr:potassium-transporting ATPase subunit KdpC [Alicyclobacillus dauci]WAH36433.1 potassium-transporting ATPase subunit KdpC [Alicyclobacillus dauci]
MINVIRAIRLSLVLALILGLGYPLLITGVGHLLFPRQAEGSMISEHGRVVGSTLIAQSVTSPGLFHPRPSAVNYAANGSGGSNLGPTNPALVKEVESNLKATGLRGSQVPPDMVESSGSGLDPDISLANAYAQVPRISKATGVPEAKLQSLVQTNAVGRFLGIWGEPYVNVLQLNMAMQSFKG